MWEKLGLKALASSRRALLEIDKWAETREIPAVYSLSKPSDAAEYRQLGPLWVSPHYRFEGWGWVLPWSVQFWVKHLNTGHSKRIVVSLL
ncbi:MAG: hypothetical protein AAFV72_00360 [Cyanobacteria bacterium J06635_1]